MSFLCCNLNQLLLQSEYANIKQDSLPMAASTVIK